MLKLDPRDIAILKILSEDGRISKAALAEKINLSPTPCWERLKRLEKAGVISGYHADVELKLVATHVSLFVTVELERHRAEDFQIFERMIGDCAEITGCWALGGGFDYLLQVTTRDIDSYQRLIDGLLEGGLAMARYFTYVVTKTVKSGGMPPFDALLVPGEDE
ncbi:AsnC family transcriptional regulator [Hoeflea marina]|uniref:AsnC family transcriptional regulator n=1 Tax=Hoeflea marina TaxID=274592 RepID=A0A317PSW4_9HYPH|nr:Lrp/AsnC family transcriptional regulator [Hoeflea marina]PWW04571.1 AsnC family transcriptional regulator [Hoeflea marina]